MYENNQLIYLGAADQGESTIEDRPRDHTVGNTGAFTKWCTHYRYEVTNEQVSRERELLQELSNRYGRLPRCNNEIP